VKTKSCFRRKQNRPMPLTITVADPLAIRLQSEAVARNIPVEQFAAEVLQNAVQSDDRGDGWAMANQRRLAFIRKEFTLGLTAAEAAELQDLQWRADQHLASLDSQMLDDVTEMERAAAQTLDAPTP
jgi:hypothetical protein